MTADPSHELTNRVLAAAVGFALLVGAEAVVILLLGLSRPVSLVWLVPPMIAGAACWAFADRLTRARSQA